MTLIVALIVYGIGWAIYKAFINAQFYAKNPGDIDNTKMTQDSINGVSQMEIRKRYGSGYYDKNI